MSGSIGSRHAGRPPADFDITLETVRCLLRTQHADLAAHTIEPVKATGWDNELFRLGETMAVRLPRRQTAAELVAQEQTWLPHLATRLPLAIPSPIRIGQPGCGYPWRWSVVPWLSGQPADLSPPDDDQGEALAAFLNALHHPAPGDAPVNLWRGVPLVNRRRSIEERMRRLSGRTDAICPRIQALWTAALEAPVDMPPTWIHADLHAQNVLVKAGALCAVIDWGDMCQGDRATDLAAIWTLLPGVRAREAAMRACADVTEATWTRARGWAVFFGVTLIDSGFAGDPRHARMGAETLRRLREGP